MTTSSPRTVLVTDDDTGIRDALREILEEEGFSVICAGNGAEALAHLKEHRPCVVVLDLMMPVMDGWEFLRRRKADPQVAAVPVIVITASRASEAPVEGVHRVLIKPFRPLDLLEAVRAHC